MAILLVGLILFFTAHLYSAFRSRETGRDIKERLGEAKYMGVFSLISLVGLIFIIWGYSQTPATSYLLLGLEGGRTLAALLMAPALLLIVSAQLPLGYIKQTVKHPMLIAVALWGAAHLIDGANLKQLLLFGSFLLYSLIDFVAVLIREKSAIGANSKPKVSNDIVTLVIAGLAYAVLVYGLHGWLFGMNPM